MYCFSDSEAEDLVNISKNLGNIVECIREVDNKETLSNLEKEHKIHEWCEKARTHKAFPLGEIQKMYKEIDEKYKEFFRKDRRDYSNEKTN